MDKNPSDIIFVVGERFYNALDSQYYITFRQFIVATQEPSTEHPGVPLYSPGQGLAEDERQSVHNYLWEAAPHLAMPKYLRSLPKSHLHKNYQENVLITELDELSKNDYRSELVIHNDNELLQDHLTGSHLPGMIFVEATRQLSIAAWSCYENSPAHEIAMLINDIHCEYHQFAFPFQTDIHASDYEGRCEFLQNGYSFHSK